MSDFRFFNTHRTWEDWCGMLLGVLIALSPWFPTQSSLEIIEAERRFVVLNTLTIGLLIFALAQLEFFLDNGNRLGRKYSVIFARQAGIGIKSCPPLALPMGCALLHINGTHFVQQGGDLLYFRIRVRVHRNN